MVNLTDEDTAFLDEIVEITGKSKEELLNMGLREFSNLLYDIGLELELTMIPKEKENGR